MNWNVCIYVDGVGGCIDVDGETGEKNELKARCELGVEKCYPSGRKRCNIRYKIDGRRIRRISKSVSCLGKNNWSPPRAPAKSDGGTNTIPWRPAGVSER